MTDRRLAPADDPFSPLGEPAASYHRALLAADEAKRRQWAAQVRCDPVAAERAGREFWEAVGEASRIKYDAATTLLMVVRWAEELFPGRLRELLGAAAGEDLDDTQRAVADLEDRVDEVVNAAEAGEGWRS